LALSLILNFGSSVYYDIRLDEGTPTTVTEAAVPSPKLDHKKTTV
jgi:hypothetical protein